MQPCLVCQIQLSVDSTIRLAVQMPFSKENLREAAVVAVGTIIIEVTSDTLVAVILTLQRTSLTSCSSATNQGVDRTSKGPSSNKDSSNNNTSSREDNGDKVVKKDKRTWAFFSNKCSQCCCSFYSLFYQVCLEVV